MDGYKIPIIFDTDPGVDDAMAFFNIVANERFDLLLVTIACGNVEANVVTRNTLKLAEMFAPDVPVSKGARKPLKIQPTYATAVHCGTGIGGWEFMDPTKKPIRDNAHTAMHKCLVKNKDRGVTIVCAGPMTNLAKLLMEHPEDKKYIKQVVFMGGSKDENSKVVPYREFNVAFDPDAVEIVINSGIPLVMIPMELGHFAYFSPEDAERMRNMNRVGEVFAKMFESYDDHHVGSLGAAVHDSCTVMYLSNPELFKTEKGFIRRLTYQTEEKEYGSLKCRLTTKTKNAIVCVDMDIDAFKWVVFDNIERCGDRKNLY